MTASELEKILLTEIPLSRAMGFRDLRLESSSLPTTDSLQLTLPLVPNKNHKGTLFGGSLYAGATLACYGLFLMQLRERGFTSNDLVIAQGEIKYLAPVVEDALIQARWPSEQEKEKFFSTLKLKQKARIAMSAEISTQGKICAQFTGQFVAHTKI